MYGGHSCIEFIYKCYVTRRRYLSKAFKGLEEIVCLLEMAHLARCLYCIYYKGLRLGEEDLTFK